LGYTGAAIKTLQTVYHFVTHCKLYFRLRYGGNQEKFGEILEEPVF
jgi:hypothetical protein